LLIRQVLSDIKLQILGCYAATPQISTHPTAQVLEMQNCLFLIDCGEGTQVEMRKHGVRFSRIRHIFISHLHGDHFFGLPGLIATFRLLGREQELHVYGPKGIKEAITLLLKLGHSKIGYPLIIHELESGKPELIFSNDNLEVHTIPLKHRIYTNGFLFAAKPGPRKLNIDAARYYGIDKVYYRKIKSGAEIVLEDGRRISNSELTFDPPNPKKYAYCSDTAYHPAMAAQIKGVDVLYHEATFLDSESDTASRTGHSTARQAAIMARDAGVGQLLLGHFSTRYKSISRFKVEAEQVFPEVLLAEEGKTYTF
jgi:ribonuclease Z